MRLRNPNELIKIEDAIKILCRKTCHPGTACPDIYCTEMWDEFKNVERVDAVSRSRVKLLLERLRDEVDDGYGFDYQSAVDDLRDMPPAQPERIRGRWGTTVASPILIVCNRCGRTVLKNGSVHWNFCPNCGAKMEVSE